MAAEARAFPTEEEYLRLERAGDIRHEYLNGEIIAMVGASREHKLKEYLLITQERCRIEHFVRQSETNWLLTGYNGPQATIQLLAIDCTLALADIDEEVAAAS